MKKSLVTSLLSAAVIFLLVSTSRADTISIGLSLGVGTLPTIPVTSSDGFASYTGSFGVYTFNNANGTGTPLVTEPNFLTNSIDISSSGGGVLNVFVTEQGLTSPSGVNSFLSSFTSNTFSGAVTSVVEQTFIDTNDGLWGGTLLASQTFTGQGSTSSINSTPSLGPGLYSETTEFTITTTGTGNVNDSININNSASSVPEPGSMVLLGSGLLGIGGIRRRWFK